MTYSEEAKATAAKVEQILKVAKASFFDAIDFLGCIEMLEAGNRPEIVQSLAAAKAGHASPDDPLRALRTLKQPRVVGQSA